MKRANIIVAVLVILGIWATVFGQDKGNETAADQTLRGSGRVNASTLGMEFSLPLGAYPGRGINVPINISYSSKLWRLEYVGNKPIPGSQYSPCYKHYRPVYSENSASGWTTSLAVPYIEYLGGENFYNIDGTPYSFDDVDCPSSQTPPESYPYYYVRRIIVHLPSGETHELRPDDTVLNSIPANSDWANPYTWNSTFYAADGSNIKYIQNNENNTYRLLMPDGSFYDFDQTNSWLPERKATTFTDRNGNYTTYNNTNGTWTDTLGRTLSAPIGLTAPAVGIYTYSMPGMSGNYKFNWKQLKGSNASESALTNFSDNLKYLGETYGCTSGSGYPTYCTHTSGTYLFDGGSDNRIVSNTLFNPVVLAEIELPTGQKYKFSYDVYGRIEKIIYPTGGEEKFQYSQIPTLSMLDPSDYMGGQANFGVTNRKVFKSSSDTSPYEWTYGAGYVTGGYKVTINNPDGTKVERYLHRGYDNGSSSGKFGYENGLAGMAYEERGYDSSSPQKLMSKKLTTWTTTNLAASSQSEPAHWHPRVTSEESIIYDTSGNGISTTTTFEYEDESNLNLRETPVLTKKSSQYAFVTAGSSLPTYPVRTSETTFLINDTNLSQTTRDIYKAQNMVGLATASVVKDSAGNIVSRSEMIYDETNYSPNVGRGNPTTLRVWDSTKGAVTNSNAYIQTRAKFDSWGNQYEAIDAKGNSTTTTFDSTYHAFPIQVTSPIPSDGTYGSNTAFVTTATFNTTTGLPLTTTDANGLETRIEYDATTLRPLNVKTYYNNTQVGTTVETVYHDETNNYWVKNRTQIDANNWKETITYFDGLGRAYKAEEVNSNGNIFVEKEFDSDGRVLRVTNPFRSGETKQWTTNVYDEASRIKEVVLPDGATVKTDYGVSTASGFIGAVVTVTDQANKQRRSITNALGQLTRVDEPDASGQLGSISSPNQPTFYNYNTIGKMTKVSQGVQNRYFHYDSLGRLLRVRQPEQTVNSALNTTGNPDNNSWTAAFSYDDNGNILSATDAKNISMSYAYDNLNRIKTRSYSDNTTPTVTYKYDNLSHAKGTLIEVSSSVSTSKTTAFNDLGQPTVFQQITDGNTYQTLYHYNSFGTLTGETYPSGRKVNYDFNQDGDLSRVWGENGNGCTSNCLKTYANAFNYNSAGAVEKLRLGNGKWETAKYNNRLQIIEIGVGNGSNDASLWKTSYEYGELQTNGTVDTTKNSGKVAKQTLTFNGLTNPLIQTYKYDSLDRLSEAEEKSNGTQTWIQQFGYDRYGNRTSFNQSIGAAQTNTTPTVDANTNRFQTGQGYVYDYNGNLVTDAEGRQFTFNGDNKQTDVKDSQNNSIGQYFYDGEGKRIKKITNTEITIFVYNGSGQLIAEYSTALSQTPTTSYLTNDNLGSPRVITDALGNVISRRDFMPFGEELYAGTGSRTENQKYTQSGTDNIRKRFTGYEKDTETGLDFAEARYYNNQHGRFTAVDPLLASGKSANPQTFNRYIYTMNNPTNLVDPSGMISESTGACGQCGNDTYIDGSAFSGTDDSFGSNLTERIYQREIRVYTVIQTEADGRSATITITSIVDRVWDKQTGKLLETSNANVTASAVNTGTANFSQSDLKTMENVSRDIVSVATDRGSDVRLALAMAQRESHLGVGARKDPGNNSKPEMDPAINPLQLDGKANLKYYASATDRKYNIEKSLQLFAENYPNSNGLEERLGHYNDGTNIGTKGKEYAKDVLNKRGNIRESVEYKYGRLDRFKGKVVYPPFL